MTQYAQIPNIGSYHYDNQGAASDRHSPNDIFVSVYVCFRLNKPLKCICERITSHGQTLSPYLKLKQNCASFLSFLPSFFIRRSQKWSKIWVSSNKFITGPWNWNVIATIFRLELHWQWRFFHWLYLKLCFWQIAAQLTKSSSNDSYIFAYVLFRTENDFDMYSWTNHFPWANYITYYEVKIELSQLCVVYSQYLYLEVSKMK